MIKKEKIYLGFVNEVEGSLYEDTCLGFLKPLGISKDYKEIMVITKDNCLRIIKEKQLEGLLESLIGLSRINRIKMINTYYGNIATLAQKMLLQYKIAEWSNEDEPIKENEPLKKYYCCEYIIANRIQEQILTLIASEFTMDEKMEFLAYSKDLLEQKDPNKIR